MTDYAATPDGWNAEYLAEEAPQDLAHTSRLAEWYLTFCIMILIVEGIFTTQVSAYISSSTYIFLQMTGYALWPSEVYFLSIGLLLGAGIYFTTRQHGVPTRGTWSFLGLCFVLVLATAHGMLSGQPFWNVDFRWMLLPAVVAPWMAGLGRCVRYEIVLSRVVKLSLPLALVNIARGLSFIQAGVQYRAGWEETAWGNGMTYQADLVLLFPYLVALSRSLSNNLRGGLSALILAAGVLAPLSKIAITTFLFANFVLLAIAASSNRREGIVQIAKLGMIVLVLIIGLCGVAYLILNMNQGAGERFLRQRFFKEGLHGAAADVSTGRFELWRHAFHQWRTNPVAGLGLGSRVAAPSRGLWLVYHNTYMRYLAQTGIIGFALAVGAFSAWWLRAWRTLRAGEQLSPQWARPVLLVYASAIAFSGLYTEALSAMCVSYLFWTCIGLEAGTHSWLLHRRHLGEDDYEALPTYLARYEYP